MAKETHEEALMRGVPSNLKGRMKDAMLSLEREKILFSVPKEGHDVWHADSRHPFFQSDENIEVLEALRTCDSLRAALADGTPLLIREISPILEKSILKVWEKKISLPGYGMKMRAGKVFSISLGDGYSAILECKYRCPVKKEGSIGPFSFEISSPTDLFDGRIQVECIVCKSTHWISADGRIIL